MVDCVLDGVERASKSRSSGFSVRLLTAVRVAVQWRLFSEKRNGIANDTTHALDEKSNLSEVTLNSIPLDILDFCCRIETAKRDHYSLSSSIGLDIVIGKTGNK